MGWKYSKKTPAQQVIDMSAVCLHHKHGLQKGGYLTPVKHASVQAVYSRSSKINPEIQLNIENRKKHEM